MCNWFTAAVIRRSKRLLCEYPIYALQQRAGPSRKYINMRFFSSLNELLKTDSTLYEEIYNYALNPVHVWKNTSAIGANLQIKFLLLFLK